MHGVPHLLLDLFDLTPVACPDGCIKLFIASDGVVWNVGSCVTIAKQHRAVVVEVLDDDCNLLLLVYVLHKINKNY